MHITKLERPLIPVFRWSDQVLVSKIYVSVIIFSKYSASKAKTLGMDEIDLIYQHFLSSFVFLQNSTQRI